MERYGPRLGTQAFAIEFANHHMIEAPGWTVEEQERRWVKMGNFNYEARSRTCPELAPRYRDEYARQLLKHNVFLAKATASAKSSLSPRFRAMSRLNWATSMEWARRER